MGVNIDGYRSLIFSSLAMWGVGCTARTPADRNPSGDLAADDSASNRCLPSTSLDDPETCGAGVCTLGEKAEGDEPTGLSAYICVEIPKGEACKSCEGKLACEAKAGNLARERYPERFFATGVRETTCSDRDGDSCCYQVEVELFEPIVGRAFRVGSERARRARTCSEALPAGKAVDVRLAGYWRTVAELEHASIASFARFTLQLLALGAPPDLIARTQRATLDEIEHARLAYGLAERFGGVEMRAGGLDIRGAVEAADPASVIRAAFIEGCVGETVAAALAARAAQRCTDPQSKAVLEQIEQDELRHACLAWSFLGWARQTFPDALRTALTGSDRLRPQPDELALEGLSEWGVLGREDQMRVCSQVFDGVIRPALAALLQGTDGEVRLRATPAPRAS